MEDGLEGRGRLTLRDFPDGDGFALRVASRVASRGENDRDSGPGLDIDLDGIETVFCASLDVHPARIKTSPKDYRMVV